MSRYRWWLLLALVFLTVFATVTWWPVSPMWIQPYERGRVIGYVNDGKSVLTWSNATSPDSLINYDVETGQVIQQHPLEIEKDWRWFGMHLLPGGKHLLVSQRYLDPATYQPEQDYDSSLIRPRRYSIMDVETLQVVAGPFIYTGSREVVTFSPDGRWMWNYNPSTGHGQDVIETMTGKTLISLRENADRRPLHICAFSPDSSAIAVQWFDEKKKTMSIELIDLPSGKIRFSHPLPPDIRFYWSMVSHWDNDGLYISALQRWRQKEYKMLCYLFPVLSDRLGEPVEAPQFEGFTGVNNGGGHVGSHTFVRGERLVQNSTGKLDTTPDWIKNSLAWIDSKLGTTLNIPSRVHQRLRFYDSQSGQLLADLSSPWFLIWEDQVSPDGRRVACCHPLTGLMMWDADPFPRWPWSWGLGLLAVGLLQLVRWRWKKGASLRVN